MLRTLRRVAGAPHAPRPTPPTAATRHPPPHPPPSANHLPHPTHSHPPIHTNPTRPPQVVLLFVLFTPAHLYLFICLLQVVLLFVLFGLSTLTFTLSMAPFFANARLAALIGPLVFFLTSQAYLTRIHD